MRHRHRRRGWGRGGTLRGDRRRCWGLGQEVEGPIGHRVGAQADQEADCEGAEDLEVPQVPRGGRLAWVNGKLAPGGNEVHQGVSADMPPTLRGCGSPRRRAGSIRPQEERRRHRVRPLQSPTLRPPLLLRRPGSSTERPHVPPAPACRSRQAPPGCVPARRGRANTRVGRVVSRVRYPSLAADLASFPGIEREGGTESSKGSEAIWNV